jgi:glycerol uptake facilitator-like aquaporin
MMTFNGDGGATHYQWVYLAFNWLGALLAVVAYECIFRRAENVV